MVLGSVQLMRGYLVLAGVAALVMSQPAAGQGEPRVTLLTDGTVLAANETVRLRGTIDSAALGEQIEIEVKDCGQPAFRGVAGTSTTHGGAWSLELYPGITTTIRASWKGSKSVQIPVYQHASVSLYRKRSTGELEVWTSGKTHFWRKYVLLQRRAGGSWKTVRQIVLTEQIDGGAGTIYSGRVNTGAIFRARLPKGTLVRTVLPRSQAKPCYLAGVSSPVRT